jgi:hypothetical protein
VSMALSDDSIHDLNGECILKNLTFLHFK